MNRVAGAGALAALSLVMSGCSFFGDRVYEYKIVNHCEATVEIIISVGAFEEPYPDYSPSDLAIAAPGDTATVWSMTSPDGRPIEVRRPGGGWSVAQTASNEMLSTGGPLVLEGDLCPEAPDHHDGAPVVRRLPFLETADGVVWTAAASARGHAPEIEGPVDQRMWVAVLGRDAWLDALVAGHGDWVEAELPELPDVVAAEVPAGTWEHSDLLDAGLRVDRGWVPHIYVNRDARVVVIESLYEPVW